MLCVFSVAALIKPTEYDISREKNYVLTHSMGKGNSKRKESKNKSIKHLPR